MDKELTKILNDATETLVKGLMLFVNKYGKDLTEKENLDFELNQGDGFRATKIWNFYEQNGCSSVVRVDKEECSSEDLENGWYDILYEKFEYTGYNCIYIEEDPDGNKELMWYGWVNGGIHFDGDQAEAHHGHVRDLSLVDIEQIVQQMRYDVLNYKK